MLRSFLLFASAILPARSLVTPLLQPRLARRMSVTKMCSDAVPTGEDLQNAMDEAQQFAEAAIAARAKADELAAMPYFKKTEQAEKQQRIADAQEWRLKADRLEEEAIEAALGQMAFFRKSTWRRLLKQRRKSRRCARVGYAYEEEGEDMPTMMENEQAVNLNGSEDRGGDINGIVSITLPTVLAVLARLPGKLDEPAVLRPYCKMHTYLHGHVQRRALVC